MAYRKNSLLIQFLPSCTEVTEVVLLKDCACAHLISTHLLVKGYFSVQRPGRFNKNVSPQCQLNNFYWVFLCSSDCWSPVSNPDVCIPASLPKQISLSLEEMHPGFEWPIVRDWISCGALSLAFGFMSGFIILYNVCCVLLIHISQG